MSHAGGDAIFDFVQICSHRVKLIFGITPPTNPQASPENRLTAIYRRIQAASPPPSRADGRSWEFGILVKDDEKNLRPLRLADGDDSWKGRTVDFVEDIASLGQPEPGKIVLDEWLRVPAKPFDRPFTSGPDRLGFLSASYPQPATGEDGKTQVRVDYNAVFDLRWSRAPESRWVAFSFDRFQPPERESVEFIGQVQKDCDCGDAAPADQDQAAQAAPGPA
jgi:hypothetical protein